MSLIYFGSVCRIAQCTHNNMNEKRVPATLPMLVRCSLVAFISILFRCHTIHTRSRMYDAADKHFPCTHIFIYNTSIQNQLKLVYIHQFHRDSISIQ